MSKKCFVEFRRERYKSDTVCVMNCYIDDRESCMLSRGGSYIESVEPGKHIVSCFPDHDMMSGSEDYAIKLLEGETVVVSIRSGLIRPSIDISHKMNGDNIQTLTERGGAMSPVRLEYTGCPRNVDIARNMNKRKLSKRENNRKYSIGVVLAIVLLIGWAFFILLPRNNSVTVINTKDNSKEVTGGVVPNEKKEDDEFAINSAWRKKKLSWEIVENDDCLVNAVYDKFEQQYTSGGSWVIYGHNDPEGIGWDATEYYDGDNLVRTDVFFTFRLKSGGVFRAGRCVVKKCECIKLDTKG